MSLKPGPAGFRIEKMSRKKEKERKRKRQEQDKYT